MVGYDFSGVIALAKQAILFNSGDPLPLIFDTGT